MRVKELMRSTPHAIPRREGSDSVFSSTTLTPTMVLFDVPGWTVPGHPVAVTPKKRKRKSKHDIQSATVNVEKVIEQLAASPAGNTRRGGVSASATEDDRPSRRKNRRRAKDNDSRRSPVQEDATHAPSKKRRKKEERPGDTKATRVAQTPSTSTFNPTPVPRGSLTNLQHAMKQSLGGARFRFVIHHER